MLGRRARALSILALSLAMACGDDDLPPPVGDAGPRRDGGPRPDGGPVPDAGPDIDAALPDGDVPLVDGGTPTCTAAPPFDLLVEPDTTLLDVEVAVGTGESGFAVGWAIDRAAGEDAFVRIVGPTGDPGPEQNISEGRGLLVGPPAFEGSGAGWLASWADNRDLMDGMTTNYELFVRALGADGAPTGAPSNLTRNTLRDASPHLVQVSGGYTVLWLQLDLRSGLPERAVRRSLDASGTPTSAEAAVGEASLSGKFAVSTLSDGIAAAWAATTTGSMREVRLLPMDADGTPRGAPGVLSAAANAAGEVDFWGSVLGGAAVYDVIIGAARWEARFRAANDFGAPAGVESSVSPAGAQGRAPSITSVGGAYGVTYRSRGRDGTLSIELVVLDSVGNELDRQTIAPIESFEQGSTWVRVAPDGAVLAVWSDTDGTGVAVRASRITCGGME